MVIKYRIFGIIERGPLDEDGATGGFHMDPLNAEIFVISQWIVGMLFYRPQTPLTAVLQVACIVEKTIRRQFCRVIHIDFKAHLVPPVLHADGKEV